MVVLSDQSQSKDGSNNMGLLSFVLRSQQASARRAAVRDHQPREQGG
jgi:hypothetical protein